MTDDKPPSTGGRRTGLLARWTSAFRAAPRDRQGLIEMLDLARRSRILDADEFSMLEGVLEVSTIQVRDIMIPRGQMVVVERNASPQDMLQIIIDSGHSRFPVIADDRDEVIGILLAKDLLRFFAENDRERFRIKECLRPAVFIPESKRLNVLLKEFRVSHNHMAIVVDEYGGVSGLLTIEDVLEQIVGEIDDEHDPDEEITIVAEQQDTWRVDALTRIEDLNEELGTAFSDADYDTVGGLVLRADRRRIHAVRLRRVAS